MTTLSAASAPRDHDEPGRRRPRLPRPLAWVRWVGWAMANRAYTVHHLASYLRMARASLLKHLTILMRVQRLSLPMWSQWVARAR